MEEGGWQWGSGWLRVYVNLPEGLKCFIFPLSQEAIVQGWYYFGNFVLLLIMWKWRRTRLYSYKEKELKWNPEEYSKWEKGQCEGGMDVFTSRNNPDFGMPHCLSSCAHHLRHLHRSEETAIWETGICWHCQQARWSHCLETIWSEFSLCQRHQHISSKSYYENCVCFSPLNKLKQNYPECKFPISLNYAFRLEWNSITMEKLDSKTYLCRVTSQNRVAEC